MTTQILNNKCDGGHYTCSPPKECCKQGCCFLISTLYRPPSVQSTTTFNPLFLGHWYFWLAITATLTGILCACTLWRKHSQGSLCCREVTSERISEPDSSGSYYAPPQYSRCNSFYQAPPPYSEVTSKPDRYPVVISYDIEPTIKSNDSSGYIMVRYFKKLLVGPVGSLSTTSTNDSLNSNFLSNVTIEANNILPPSYSSTGSLEDVASSKNCQTITPKVLPQLETTSPDYIGVNIVNSSSALIVDNPKPIHQLPSQVVSNIRNNPCFDGTTTNDTVVPTRDITEIDAKEVKNQNKLDSAPPNASNSTIERCSDIESQEDNNFAALLNLSVCVPNTAAYSKTPISSNPLPHDGSSIATSMTGSDVSSLANFEALESPPRATSPTLEMKQLLNKIQMLPQQSRIAQDGRSNRNFVHKAKAHTLYMPLTDASENRKISLRNVSSKHWLSRSAPNTPSTNFIPSFPINRSNNRDGGSKFGEGSPLLLGQDCTEEDL